MIIILKNIIAVADKIMRRFSIEPSFVKNMLERLREIHARETTIKQCNVNTFASESIGVHLRNA
jgi:hypothetical protein